MQEARGLFDELDVDGSGAVDGAELEGLVRKLWAAQGVAVKAGQDVGEEVAVMLGRFDKDGSGTLSFDEMLAMLCEEPWGAMMSAGVRGAVREAVSVALGLPGRGAAPGQSRGALTTDGIEELNTELAAMQSEYLSAGRGEREALKARLKVTRCGGCRCVALIRFASLSAMLCSCHARGACSTRCEHARTLSLREAGVGEPWRSCACVYIGEGGRDCGEASLHACGTGGVSERGGSRSPERDAEGTEGFART